MIDKQIYLDAQKILTLINSGQVDMAMTLDEQLRQRIAQTTMSLPQTMRESIDVVATTLREAGQEGMALPWYEDLCVLNMELDPDSAKTAWDWYYLADIYIKCSYSANDLQSSQEYFRRASKTAEMAAKVCRTSGTTDKALLRDINTIISLPDTFFEAMRARK